jgi:hypothetical protein
MHVTFWLENMKGRDHLGEVSIGGRLTLKLILKKQSGRMWIGFTWLRTGTSGMLL